MWGHGPRAQVDPEKLLSGYLRADLMMAEQPDFDALVGKAAKSIGLKHVLALVEALSQHQVIPCCQSDHVLDDRWHSFVLGT